ncbi:ABC transporter substrate-binding protein [Microlunatus sp. GCM10028923]|uniref:ABC transporter substrate-binding protein n=1 Tax=Microlunatus sp. GCM10028923 TaxID=3273400 RepID=UPI00360CFCF2
MINRRELLAASAALAPVGLVAAGCAGSAEGAPGSGQVLRIAMSAGNIPFPSTPPNEGYEGYRFVGNNLYDALTRLDLDQNETLPSPKPSLGTSWTVSKDLRTWTFKLRKGVRFHDGTAFDADAVIFQLDRLANQKSEFFYQTSAAGQAAQLRYIKSYAKVDDHTVRFVTTQPYAWLHWDLLHIKFPSPAVIREYGNENYNAHAVGTGPFLMTRYVDGEVMELSRNPDYWDGPAKLDQIVLYPQPEAASRLSMLMSGEVDWAEVPSPDALDQLESDGYVIHLGKYPHGIMPRFNVFRPPFAGNLKLRQALNYALDREGTAALINNVGYPASQYVYEGHPAYAKDNPGYHYDVDRAKQLLAEAGYQPGELTITFGYTTGGSGNMYPDVMVQKLQADFAAIGVGVNLQPMEWNTLISVGLDGLNSETWNDIDLLWASPAAGMTPTGYNASFFCERPGGKPNAAGTCDPGIDQALTLAPQQATPAAQDAYLQQMMDVAVDQAYFLFWMHDLNLRVMSPRVQGYVQAQSWWVDFTTISIGTGD